VTASGVIPDHWPRRASCPQVNTRCPHCPRDSLSPKPVFLFAASRPRLVGLQLSMLLRAIGDQVRALFLAQRPPTGQLGNSAWAGPVFGNDPWGRVLAEDDYARFSNRSCQSFEGSFPGTGRGLLALRGRESDVRLLRKREGIVRREGC